MMRTRLDGKVALVTGGASGIGESAARLCAQAGAHVVVADRDARRGAAVAAAIARDGAAACFVEVDVSDRGSVDALIGATLDRFGRLDCAFNNAGIADGARSLLTSSQENWDRVIGINLEGVWLCMQAELSHMLAHGGGTIVNNASRSGLRGIPSDAIYGAAKHGVIGLTKAAAVEFADRNIRVNAICPGLIDTALTRERFGAELAERAASANPMGRAAHADEVAHAVLWLCSDASSFVTGVALPVDGGSTAR